MQINQDVEIYAGILEEGDEYTYSPEPDRGLWVQLVQGKLQLNTEDTILNEGDGVGITGVGPLKLRALDEAELILFDVAMEFETPYKLE